MTLFVVDVEKLLASWLPGALAAAYPALRVVTETPADLEQQVPLVELARIGGADRERTVDAAVVDVTAYGATRADANALALQVWQAMRYQLPGASVPGVGHVVKVDTISGPSWHPYTNTSVRRYGATYVVTTRP